MTSLMDFLGARIDEDAARANPYGGALWNARALRDVKAKREIVAACLLTDIAATPATVALDRRFDPTTGWLPESDWTMVYPSARSTLHALARVYSDHPDFDDAWLP